MPFMLSVVLNVIELSGIMASVVAPITPYPLAPKATMAPDSFREKRSSLFGHMTISKTTFSIMTLSIIVECYYAECCFVECHLSLEPILFLLSKISPCHMSLC
jgi:hypothetical protein